ncbi:MAG: hypothetical protein KAX49_14810 [Halanaerobiales bacterium]|nr:hypothetical protein [Halanaerobiales bacterium]
MALYYRNKNLRFVINNVLARKLTENSEDFQYIIYPGVILNKQPVMYGKI